MRRRGTQGGHQPEGGTVVEARDVWRIYRRRESRVEAVRGVSLRVRPGDFLSIAGPSGSGKSTLLHLLGAIDTPSRGTVRMDGREVGTLSDRERTRLRLRRVGLVFQRFHLLSMLDATENVALPMAEAGAGRRERTRRARQLLERVGLADRLDHRPGELSGGERQRVAVARALANEPALLLADEPTGELDRATSREILGLFRELNAAGTTLVVATHDEELAAGAGTHRRLVDGRLEAAE